MTRGRSVSTVLALLAAFAVVPACGESGTSATPNFCEERDGLICAPAGLPFVKAVFADSDFCDPTFTGVGCPATTIPPAGASTARLSVSAPGSFCLAGTVAPDGFVAILFRFDTLDRDGTVATTFDAAARGITQWAFTIDSPPSAGAIPGTFGFHVGNPPVYITQPGPQVVRFADFMPNDGTSGTIDTSVMPPIGVAVREGSYDFCVRDFTLLDAAGSQVTP
ncbi:MAG TPA: hypothetical protein VIQ54_05225 [Polyangia bacterium]|jgi:hypothetical protein